MSFVNLSLSSLFMAIWPQTDVPNRMTSVLTLNNKRQNLLLNL